MSTGPILLRTSERSACSLPECDGTLPPISGMPSHLQDWHRGQIRYCRRHRLASNQLFKFGINIEQYMAMYRRQLGRCAICKKHALPAGSGAGVKQLVVDHCHRTNRVRALLCWGCNVSLGHFQDDAKLLRTAAAYLEAK